MNVEKLIEGIRKRDILYYCMTKAYKDTVRNEDAWNEAEEGGRRSGRRSYNFTSFYCESSKHTLDNKLVCMWTVKKTFFDCHIGLFAMHMSCIFPEIFKAHLPICSSLPWWLCGLIRSPMHVMHDYRKGWGSTPSHAGKICHAA